jgi:hypothetical protein
MEGKSRKKKSNLKKKTSLKKRKKNQANLNKPPKSGSI